MSAYEEPEPSYFASEAMWGYLSRRCRRFNVRNPMVSDQFLRRYPSVIKAMAANLTDGLNGVLELEAVLRQSKGDTDGDVV